MGIEPITFWSQTKRATYYAIHNCMRGRRIELRPLGHEPNDLPLIYPLFL